MPKRSRLVVFSLGLGAILALLVARAAEVQHGSSVVGVAGAVLGICMGVAYCYGRISEVLVGAVLGSITLLIFGTCYPCDGSTIIAPTFGAACGGLLGKAAQWFVSIKQVA